jgi:hypothetical protein
MIKWLANIPIFQTGGSRATVKYDDSGSANVILYIGLGMVAIGLVITFVGLGDKGFKTLELKLIGPSLVGCGVFFALLRILFCTVPSCCSGCREKQGEGKGAVIDILTEGNIKGDIKTTGAAQEISKPMSGARMNQTEHAARCRANFSSGIEETEPKRKLVPIQKGNKNSHTGDRKPEFEQNFSDSFTSTLSLEELRPRLPHLGGAGHTGREGEVVISAKQLKEIDTNIPLKMYNI